jgi:hypothetical protein
MVRIRTLALLQTCLGLCFTPPEHRVYGMLIEAEKKKLTRNLTVASDKLRGQPPLPKQRLVR